MDYNILKEHPLFIKKEDRKDFHIRQWEINKKMNDFWKHEYMRTPHNYFAQSVVNMEETTNQWFEYFATFFEEYGIKPTSILDFGCGNGRFTRRLKDFFKVKTIGIDIIDDVIETAKKEHPDIPFLKYNGHAPRTDMVFFTITLAYIWDEVEYKRVIVSIKDSKYIVLFEPFFKHEIRPPLVRLTIEKLKKDLPNHDFKIHKPKKDELSSISDDYMFVLGIRC